MAIQSRTMIGRDAELSALAASLGIRPARSPQKYTDVLLAGDAGVGKTRVLRALRDLAVGEGWQVFAGHCLDFGDSALPYLPFSEVVDRLATELPDVVAAVGAEQPALGRLQPARRVISGARADQADPADAEGTALDRADLFRAVQAVLEAAAEVKPLLLVIEDAHWADQSTRDMLSFLLSRQLSGGFAVIASYRSDDLHRRHPLRAQVAEWSRLRGTERIQLGPLSDDDVRALVGELAPGLAESDLADVVARAEGNAFFVEELVAAAADAGSAVPADLADVLLVRLDRLDDSARQVVRTASASGRRVTHEMLEATAGLDLEALDDGIRGAVEMNVLVAERGGYAFRHALLGEAVYDDLLPGERVRLHGRYVEALRDGTAAGTAAELARHARLARDRETALDASIRAGNEAMAVGGPDEAAYHYQQAIELVASRPSDAVDLSKLVSKAADALVASGDPERAASLIADQLADLPVDAPASWRARLLMAQASALLLTESDHDAHELSTRAVELAPEGESGLRARVLVTHARILAAFGRDEEAQSVGVDALELAERLDLTDLASDAVTTLSGLKRTGPKEALRQALEEAVEKAAAHDALEAELRGRFLLGRSYQDWGEHELAVRWFRSAVECAERLGTPWAPYPAESRWQLAWVLFALGDLDGVRDALVVEGPFPPPIPRAQLTTLRLTLAQWRGDDVSARVQGLRPFWRREGVVAIHAAAIEMVAAGRRRDPDAVLAAYDDAITELTAIWHEHFGGRVRLAALAAGALADCMPAVSGADRARLVEQADRLRADGAAVVARYADPAGHWGPEGRAWARRLEAETLRAHWLADTDAPSLDDLVQAWRDTEALFVEYGHVPETAWVRVKLAGILRATGDLAGARQMSDPARATAERLEAGWLLDELRAIGSAPVAREEPAGDALTNREREILAHVAEGRSNGEIARLLFISTKTVSVHVSNILGKLGASGRTEAAAIARRRRMID